MDALAHTSFAAVLLACTIAGAQATGGQPPATQRASATPSAASTQPSRQALLPEVADLGNADAGVRERARRELLGMSRDQLLALPGMLGHQSPLNASQRALLHEIVIHVFLATEPYPSDSSKGFLGIRDIAAVHVALPGVTAPAAADDQAPNVDSLIDPGDEPPDTGIIVPERLPGFCGYRAFENGDVILAARDGEMIPIRTVQRLQEVVQAHHAGDSMTFQVLRRGKIIDVKLRLDGLPAAVAPGAGPAMAPETIQAFFHQRTKAAQDFWDQHFAAVAGPHA